MEMQTDIVGRYAAPLGTAGRHNHRIAWGVERQTWETLQHVFRFVQLT